MSRYSSRREPNQNGGDLFGDFSKRYGTPHLGGDQFSDAAQRFGTPKSGGLFISNYKLPQLPSKGNGYAGVPTAYSGLLNGTQMPQFARGSPQTNTSRSTVDLYNLDKTSSGNPNQGNYGEGYGPKSVTSVNDVYAQDTYNDPQYKYGDGLFSSALNVVKGINNTIQDAPRIAAKIATAPVKLVGNVIGGPVKQVTDVVTDVVKGVANVITPAPAENPDWSYKWRSKQPNENHALLKDGTAPFWRLYRAKYAGPGTALSENIRQDIQHYGSLNEMVNDKHFVGLMDKEGLAHDIRYALAPLEKDPAAAVVAADKKFIAVGLKLLKSNPLDVNVHGSLDPILAKYAGDKILTNPLGFLDKNKDGSLKKPSPEDEKLYREVLAKLTSQGYGKMSNIKSADIVMNPKAGKKGGQRLQVVTNPWMSHLAQVRQQNPTLGLKEAMAVASKSYKGANK